MPILPVKLVGIASRQLSPSLPRFSTRTRNNLQSNPHHMSQIEKTSDGRHWFIAGKTGMGKTKLIKEIVRKKIRLNPHINVYNIDTKKIGDFTSADGTMIVSEIAPDAFTTTGHRMVWQPLRDDKKQYDIFFKRILDAQLPAIVNIDETVNMKFGTEIPRELAILLLQGRAAGINVIGGTQQVAKSPRELLSQATYIVSFNLTNEYDVNTMIRYLELDQRKLNLKKYEFYFLDTDSGLSAKKFKSYSDLLPLVH